MDVITKNDTDPCNYIDLITLIYLYNYNYIDLITSM